MVLMAGFRKKKKFRGKCPRCKTINVTSSPFFTCHQCGFELQLKGKNAARARQTIYLAAIPLLMFLIIALILVGLLFQPDRVMALFGYEMDESNMTHHVEDASEKNVAGDASKSLDPAEIFARSKDSVITIHASNEDGGVIGIGSGFFIDYPMGAPEAQIESAGGVEGESPHDQYGYVMTNAHVIDSGSVLVAKRGDKHIGSIDQIMLEDEKVDLAIIRVRLLIDTPPPPLAISADLPAIGSRAYAIGSPRGLDQTFTEGMVSGKRNWNAPERRLQITDMIDSGSSGGPILNDRGMVVAVAVSKLLDSDIRFAIPQVSLVDFLSRAPNPRLPAHGRSFRLEFAQTKAKAIAAADSESKAEHKVQLEQLILALFQLESAPAKAAETLEPLLDEFFDEWSFFAHHVVGTAKSRIAKDQDGSANISTSPEYEDAIRYLERSNSLRQKFIPATIELCDLLLAGGDAEKCLEISKTLVRRAPNCPDAYVYCGESCLALKNEGEAANYFVQALATDPNASRIRERFIEFLDTKPKREKAIQFIRQILAHPQLKRRGTWHYLLGLTLEKHGEFAAAIASFQDSMLHGVLWPDEVIERMNAVQEKIAEQANKAQAPE